MSDYGYDPNADPYSLDDAQLMEYILGSSANGGVYGKDPSARLTTLSKMQSMLTGPLMESMFPSATTTAAPELAPNLQRQVYGNNPLFASLFDTMDSGADPLSAMSAVSQAVADGKFQGMTPQMWESQKEQIQKVAEDYGFESAKNMNAYNAASTGGPQDQFLQSDGTPYKGSKGLGRGTLGMASEFELMGAPSQDEAKNELMNQYAAANPRTYKTPETGTTGRGGLAGVTEYAVNRQKNAGVIGQLDAARTQVDSKKDAIKKFGNNKVADFMVKERLDKAKGTQVRSEASKDLAYKILAMRALSGS